MSTGTDVIHDALQRIGAHSVASPAAPESVDHGRKVLNGMLQEWEGLYISLGTVPLEQPGEELSEPMDAYNGIVENLAIRLAPDFSSGKQVASEELKRNARRSFTTIKKLYQRFTLPKPVVSSTMPMGAGNMRGTWRRTFAGHGKEIDD